MHASKRSECGVFVCLCGHQAWTVYMYVEIYIYICIYTFENIVSSVCLFPPPLFLVLFADLFAFFFKTRSF